MRTNEFQNISDCTEFRRLTNTPVPKPLHATTLILLLLIAVAVTWLAMTEANLVVIAQGRVRPIAGAEQNWEELVTLVASEAGGQVDAVLVDAGQRIKQGDVLLQFNTKRLENQHEQLNQKIATIEKELQRLNEYQSLFAEKAQQDQRRAGAEIEQAEAEINEDKVRRASAIRSAQAELNNAQDQYDRNQQLLRQQAVSQREIQESETKLALAKEKVAQAKLQVSEERLNVLSCSQQAVIRDASAKQKEIEIQIETKRGVLRTLLIELADTELQIQRSTVVASSDGVVTEVNVKAGDVLQPGKIGISTAQQEGLALVVDVTSNDVGHLKAGMRVRVKMDAFDFREYGIVHGTLKFVAPDSRVIEGPDKQRISAFRVTIELADDRVSQGAQIGDIKLGMTGTSEIVTQRKSLLLLLLQKINRTISLT